MEKPKPMNTHSHRRQCGDGQRQGKPGLGQGGKMGTSVIVSTIKGKKSQLIEP